MTTITGTPTPTTLVCHVTNNGQDANTLKIPASDVQLHIDHGDSLGECPLDCMGIPGGRAVVDSCGVCGGDGSSCPELCTFYNITKVRRKLLRESRKLFRSVKLYSQRQQSCGQVSEGSRRIKLAKGVKSTVERLLFEISGTSLKVCDTPYCKSVSLGAWKKTIKSRIRVLLALAKKAQYGAVDACGRYGEGARSFSLLSSAGAKRLVGQLPSKVCNN